MDDLEKKPNGASTAASNGDEEDAEIARLRNEIQSLNSNITELMGRIGEYYWQSFLTEGQYEPELKGVFDDIRTQTEEMADLEQDIQATENDFGQPIQPPVQFHIKHVICESCGTADDASAELCSSCGTPLEDDKSNEQPERRAENYEICPLCGARLEDDAIFCNICGARIQI